MTAIKKDGSISVGTDTDQKILDAALKVHKAKEALELAEREFHALTSALRGDEPIAVVAGAKKGEGGNARMIVLAFLRGQDKPSRTEEIVGATNFKASTVRQSLSRMRKEKSVRRVAKGLWEAAKPKGGEGN